MIFPQRQTESQNYYYYPQGFSPEELDKIYQDLESISFVEATTFGNKGEAPSVDKKTRRSRIKWIPQTQEWRWLYERLMGMAHEANQSLWHFDLISAPEMIQYTEYLAEEEGFYNWHQDIGPGVGSLRKVSMTVQLSDPSEYEGGVLELWLGSDTIVSAEKNAGLVFVFPSYLMHRVTTVTKGVRRSFVLWVGGSHYR